MADEQGTVRNVSWNEVFGFAQIFKSWGLARQPSKLLLAAAAVVILFVAGWVLDGVFGFFGVATAPTAPARHAMMPSLQYDQAMEAFWDEDTRRERAARMLEEAQQQFKKPDSFLRAVPAGPYRSALDKILDEKQGDFVPQSRRELLSNNPKKSPNWFIDEADEKFHQQVGKIRQSLNPAYDKAEEDIENNVAEDDRPAAYDKLADDHAEAQQQLSMMRLQYRQALRGLEGVGVGEAFMDYQWRCCRAALTSIWYGNFTGGLYRYQQIVENRGPAPIAVTPNFDPYGWRGWFGVQPQTVAGMAGQPTSPDRFKADPPGMLVATLMAYRGVVWLLSEHTVYAVIYLLIALSTIAFFGGAISRMAALQYARDEKISIMQALRFACGKFLSFFSAPLIPLVLIAFLGLLISVMSLLLNVPWLGEILYGLVLLPLLILFGLAIAFLTIGLVAGGPLMFPTIGIEGSDAFDAISRSFSYVFSRPGRAILYGFVAVIFGGLTYMFVRFFAFLALKATHMFMSLGVWTGGTRLAPNADKVDVVWAEPTYSSLWGPFNWDAMTAGESVGAFLFGIWTFLIAALVAGYLISYFFSSTTVIYCLLRRKVDATDLDDVYVEEEEEWPMTPTGEEEAAPEQPAGEQPGEQPAEEQGQQPAEGQAETGQENADGEQASDSSDTSEGEGEGEKNTNA